MTLYRQYRPSTFAALVGQDTVRTILQNALAREKLSHAYLFAGPRGTGKTSTARILARAATCLKPVVKEVKGQAVYEPCNECASCVAQLNDQTTDIIEIDAASNRGIEDIRQLREQAQLMPMQLSRKVYIIDEVHMLTNDAFNALLKTLEEPPAHCVFILATTDLHKVPATIRSRCQLLRFERGSVEAISAKLLSIIEAEQLTVDAQVPGLIARHASGGFRDAETVLEQLTTQFSPLLEADARQALGIPDADQLGSLLAAMLAGDFVATRDALAALPVFDQHRCEVLLGEIIESIREKLHATKDQEEASVYGQALTVLLEGYMLVKGSPHPKLVLETVAYQIAGLGQRGIRPQEPVKPMESLPLVVMTEKPTAVATRPVVLEPKAVVEPVAPIVELSTPAIKDIRLAWKEAIKQISKKSAPFGQILRETVIHTAENNTLVVHVKYKFHVEKLSEKKHMATVEGLLENLTGAPWRVLYELKDTLPRRQTSSAISSNAAAAAAEIFSQG